MSDLAIRVESVSKCYQIGAETLPYRRLSESVWDGLSKLARGRNFSSKHTRPDWIWALKDVSLEISEGQVAGIIGRNGAGKTTLLKVLSRVTEPTSGRAVLSGRVGSLLEVGTGFHPELTGGENIFLNGAILGMTKSEIVRKFDDIVSFAEVERFIDTPVKRYSSGMYVRLAFAVAAHLEPDILIVDEVLAVGDAGFQRRCLGKMGEVAAGGRTVLFVSHNMAAVRSLCTQAYLFDSGRLVAEGAVDTVLQEYSRKRAQTETDLASRVDRKGSGRLRFLHFVGRGDGDTDVLECGAPASFTIRYSAPDRLRHVHISMALRSSLGESVMYLANELSGDWFEELPPEGLITCRFDKLPFVPGTYYVTLYSSVAGITADWVTEAAVIDVETGDFFGSGKLPSPHYGAVLAPHRWNAKPLE